MKTGRRFLGVICLAICLLLPCAANAQNNLDANWWDNNTLIAKGCGFPPVNAATLEQSRTFAKRGAMLDAYRKLIEQAKNIRITAKETIGLQIAAGDIAEKKISALISGAEILSEEFDAVGNCIVVLSVPIYGVKDSVAKVAFKPVVKEDFPLPTADKITKGNYTGLIIDCGDYNLNPVLLPVIRNENNISIYSYNNLDYDKVVSNGMVAYAQNNLTVQSFDAASSRKLMPLSYTKIIENKLLLLTDSTINMNSRAGNNPLIIKATSMSDDNSCPIISADDADRILAENQISHFLDDGAVVFTGYRVGGVRA